MKLAIKHSLLAAITGLLFSNAASAVDLTASEQQLAGLNSFIEDHQLALKAGDTSWTINHEPRHIAEATFSGQDYASYRFGIDQSTPDKIASVEIDMGRQVCAIVLGDLVLAIVEHNMVRQRMAPENVEKVYLNHEGKWWVTDNQDMRTVLSSFREDMFKAINTPEVFAELQQNTCYQSLNR
ncbi:hypothetical protein HR060_07740 [Catenovulum sp. SM1970]|uniref:hypothetical protein n=1 Tax=Marinifaba aquimaris TaxID=2741323 RepID=UPI001574ECE9|nr:hypothetical protein [Marinifaba aquimaris]NTS76760.1 hypothetical protein [Marinifaba aquimaris]